MKVFSELNDPGVVRLLKQGAVGVIPTDTIYGIVARADDETAVERLYAIRKRNLHKACIVLIAKISQIADRSTWGREDLALAQKYWPGAVSIIFPVSAQTPHYLHRGKQSLAYRMPDFPALQTLLHQVGPLVAPSANLEGQPPATTFAEAQAYFGDTVGFYVDGGKLKGVPSRLIKIDKGKITTLR